MTALSSSSAVAVVGSGAMGAGIAQIAAAAGHPVMLYDAREDAPSKAIDHIRESFRKERDKGRMNASDADSAAARLTPVTSLEPMTCAQLVIEAIVEDLDAKRHLFTTLEAIVGGDCILASNTSSLSITALAAGLHKPERVVGMHFFNPAPRMALVEVVSGLATDVALAQTVYDTAAAWGKSPVYTKSTPGFIVNRVARPFYSEALRLLQEQVADAATLDAVMRECGGFRMGPFELMDLIGHDVNFAVTQSVFRGYFNDPRFTPSVIQRELVDAGWLGRKSGRGFYVYGDGAPLPPPATEGPAPVPKRVVARQTWSPADAIVARLSGSPVAIERRPRASDGAPLFEVDGTWIYLADGRSATRIANETEYPDVVVLDVALDFAEATRVALARADRCSTSAFQAAVGMFQAAQFAVSVLRDVPGMAVMRTVAMLANEAADAVNQGVCSADAVDIAMQKGVNYPRGPLAWADAIGAGRIRNVLHHLAAHYGEDRYRISPLISRLVWTGEGLHA
ncbi:3-hydroxyacyl-CoA dehydrogenase PaaC [Pendulispora rubella]|uniref:3-hydroxyacyl-CoA dehydrogenase PaaC n=1 Tax=Pendulispora rubella TaxID=2741070 RepID=A0ABZ2LD35_9BACT